MGSDKAARHTVACLVERACSGEREAFGILVRRYQDYAYGVAAGLLGDPELGRDVVQESFVTAYLELAHLREPARFGGWLHGIVRHTSFRALRELGRLRHLSEELARPEHGPPPVPTPDDGLLAAERRDTVRLAMGQLSERHREVVGLHYMDGLSYAQIAEFLGVTETTVQGRLQRARAQLRETYPMVEETYKGQRLSDDFAAEVDKLLRTVADEESVEKTRAAERLAAMGAAAVDPLCEVLEDAKGAVRQVALWALCHIGDERACRPVLRLLYAQNPWKTWRLSAQAGLMRIPGVRDALMAEARAGRGRPRRRPRTVSDPPHMAIRVLSLIEGDTGVQDLLEEIYRDVEYRSWLRIAAVVGLCRLQPDRAVEWVVDALRMSDRRFRGAIVWHAVATGLIVPLDACVEAFRSGNFPGTRAHMSRLILRHGDAGCEALREIARDSSGDTHWAAVLALGSQGDPESLSDLREELLQTTRPERAGAISQVMAAQAGDELQAWVDDGQVEARSLPTLMWGLAGSRRGADSETMEHLAREGTPAIRAAAVRLLARARGAAYLPQLREFLAEGKPRKVAQEAFWQMHALRDQAAPTARTMLSSEHWTERKAGVCLLRRWGCLTDEERHKALADEHIAVRHGGGAPRR